MTYHEAMPGARELHHYIEPLIADGFVFVDGDTTDTLLGGVRGQAEWTRFASSWNDLAVDAYLAGHGTFRRRRHAVFSLTNDGEVLREPHRPHYQSKTYNTLQGGIERWFEPIESTIADSDIFRRILSFCAKTFGNLAPDVARWIVEAHQFRIEAYASHVGLPTPEGVHRDGVDYVLVALIARTNIESGTTTIHDASGKRLGHFTLTQPLDVALVDDARVFHGVTPVHPSDPKEPAHRDVLVVTLRAT
jgi:hypothetical protein